MGILPSYSAAPASPEDRYFSQLTSEEQIRFRQETKDAILLEFKTRLSRLNRAGVLVAVTIALGTEFLLRHSSPSKLFPAPAPIKFMVAVPMLVMVCCFFGAGVSMFRLDSLVSEVSQGESGWSASDPISTLKRAIDAASEQAVTKKEHRS